MAAKLERQISSVYLLASRRATTVPTIENVEGALQLLKKPYVGRLHTLLESRFGLPRHYLKMKRVSDNHVSLPYNVQEVTAIAREHFEAILMLAREERMSYRQYLEGCGLRYGQAGIVVSDLGYSGNIQKALAKLLGIPLTGYYFVTSHDIFDDDKVRHRFYGYFAENDDPMITECAGSQVLPIS